jgi:hypothetical protein
VLEWAARNSEHLMSTVEAARAETIEMGAVPMGQVTVEMEYAPEDYVVDYEIVTGGGEGQSGMGVDTIQVTGARLMKKPVATRLRDRPWAYLLPRDAEAAVELLRRHGITVERLLEPVSLDVQAYTVADVTHEAQYNHAAVTRIQVGDVVTRTMEFPAGTYVVPTAQNLGRLAAHMLEVETEDNVVYWNTMDAWVPRPGTQQGGGGGQQAGPPLAPIFKLMAPTALRAVVVDGG